MSVTRKKYILRLIFRGLVLLACGAAVILHPERFTILEGMNFFREFSLLHLLWLIWGGGHGPADYPHQKQAASGLHEAVRQPVPAHPGQDQQ